MKSIHGFIFLIPVFVQSCVDSGQELGIENPDRNLLAEKYTWGGEREEKIVDSCLFNSVTMEMLIDFIDAGGDVNAFVERDFTHTEEKIGNQIPFIKEFVSDELVIKRDVYQLNVFQALICRSPENKMELCVYLLKNGADPNIKSPEGYNALEYLLSFLSYAGTYHLERERDEFSKYRKPDKYYSASYIDTLVAHGADSKSVKLHCAGSNYYLLKKMLELGSDPKTININELLNGDYSDTKLEQLPEILRYGPDYSQLISINIVNSARGVELVDAMLKGGFNPNTKTAGGDYLLDQAILANKFALVELLVENGATEVSNYETPYDLAKECGASESILKLLREKKQN